MAKIHMHFEGEFSVFIFVPGHSQLLFRRDKAEKNGKRIEVLFKGVYSMEVRVQSMVDLVIEELNDWEAPKEKMIFKNDGTQLGVYYRLTAEGFTGYVVAENCHVAEDEEDFLAPSNFDVFVTQSWLMLD